MIGNMNWSCPSSASTAAGTISLAHGEGGRLMRELLADLVVPILQNEVDSSHADSVLPKLNGQPVFTTDSFVVSPRFFPGGNIGSLAVYVTVNDLAVAGARPMWLSLSLIIEEGLSREELLRILTNAASAARNADVTIVTGDTMVLPRGAVDGLLINTSGLGELIFPMPGAQQLEVDDAILVTGSIARHGIAVLAARESLGFDPPPESESGNLFPAMRALHKAGIPLRAARDATRGGVAAVLHEWSAACQHSIAIDEHAVPLTSDVRGACELLGLDPLHVACEGTMVLAVPGGHSAAAIEVLHSVRISATATRIGQVIRRALAPVLVNRVLRRLVPLDELSGAPMPRIC